MQIVIGLEEEREAESQTYVVEIRQVKVLLHRLRQLLYQIKAQTRLQRLFVMLRGLRKRQRLHGQPDPDHVLCRVEDIEGRHPDPLDDLRAQLDLV